MLGLDMVVVTKQPMATMLSPKLGKIGQDRAIGLDSSPKSVGRSIGPAAISGADDIHNPSQ